MKRGGRDPRRTPDPPPHGTAVTTGFRRVCLVIASLSTPLVAQDSSATGHFHVGLTVHDWGISIGNAPRVNGLRINIQDAGLERVNGINVTLWKPRDPLSGTVNGLQVGLVPGSQIVSGIALGVGGVVAERRARWVTVGGLGAVSNGDFSGLVVGGLGTVANRDISGIALGGLGTVANRRITGIAVAGLGTVANEDIVGVAIAGLGTVANRDITGVGVAGLGLVANDAVRGLAVGGLGTVANGSISGIAIGGLAVVTNGRLTGVAIGGLAVVANAAVRGIGIAGYTVDSHALTGVSVSAYNRVRGPQRGLTIGLYNSAYELHGVQVGVLNRAKNNRAPFKILPLVNLHL